MKQIKRIFLFGLLLTAVTLVAGYFYIQGQLPGLPQKIQGALRENRVELGFATQKTGPGLTLSLEQFILEGQAVPYQMSAKTFSVALKPQFAFPPLSVALKIENPSIKTNEKYVATPRPTTEPTSVPSFFQYLVGLNLLGADIHIQNLAALEYGVESADIQFTLHSFSLGANGQPKLKGFEKLALHKLQGKPWFPGLSSEGSLEYADQALKAERLTVSLGALPLSLQGEIHIPTVKWKASASLPETDLGSLSDAMKTVSQGVLQKMTGRLGIQLATQGMGFAWPGIQMEGAVTAKNLALELHHAQAEGLVNLDVDTKIQKTDTLKITGKWSVDLSNTEIKNGDLFRKAKGIPLKASVKLSGGEKQMVVEQVDFNLSNLKATARGNYEYGNGFGEASTEISKTELAGWEKFFPKYQSVKSEGTLEAKAKFKGVFQNWKQGELEATINAEKVRVPIIPGIIPKSDLDLEGIAEINSRTVIAMSRGALEQLSTQTSLNLQSTGIKYGTYFSKPIGTAFNAKWNLKTAKSRAEIKDGLINLGKIQAKITGLIQNFENPDLNLNIASNTVSFSEILGLVPPSLLPKISNPQGTVRLNAKVQGKPLAKNTDFSQMGTGTIVFDKLAFQYPIPSTTKNLQVTSLSGELGYRGKSLGLQIRSFATPQTQLSGNCEVKSFEPLVLTASISGKKFTLSDFYDLPKGGAAPGISPIPVSTKAAAPGGSWSGEKKEADFRKTPWIKNLVLRVDTQIAQWDFGYLKGEKFNARLDFDHLLWKISPLSFQALGGSVSSDTIWNGREATPKTKQDLTAKGVDADGFLGSYSPEMRGYVSGKLNLNSQWEFLGVTANELTKSITGGGHFSISAPQLKTIKLTQKPLETLKKTPLIGKYITKTDWEERLNDVGGDFKVQNGKVAFSNLVLTSPYFEARGSETSVDFDKNLQGKMLWIPKQSIMPASAAEVLRDENGVTSLPLTLSGNLTSPSVNLDTEVIASRAKAYLTRKADQEKERAVAEIQKKAGDALNKKLQEGIGGIFK